MSPTIEERLRRIETRLRILKNWVQRATGGGNSFETIAVSGQSNVVADSSTDTLTVAAGSNVTITTNAGTDTVTIAATDTTVLVSGGSSGSIAASTTAYLAIAGNLSATGTEAPRQANLSTAGTLNNVYAFVNLNATTADSTLRSRINAANGAIVITITATTTGTFSDTTNSDSIALNDEVNYQLISGAGGAITVSAISGRYTI